MSRCPLLQQVGQEGGCGGGAAAAAGGAALATKQLETGPHLFEEFGCGLLSTSLLDVHGLLNRDEAIFEGNGGDGIDVEISLLTKVVELRLYVMIVEVIACGGSCICITSFASCSAEKATRATGGIGHAYDLLCPVDDRISAAEARHVFNLFALVEGCDPRPSCDIALGKLVENARIRRSVSFGFASPSLEALICSASETCRMGTCPIA